MARRPNPKSDFVVSVEGIGDFTFARRRMSDEIAIQVEYARLIQGVEPTDWLATVCGWISTLKVLTVFAPDGWDIEDMDPLEDETYKRISLVNSELAKRERSFRSQPEISVQAGGAGESKDDRVLVSP